MSTVKHECPNTWRPIEEFGKGAGRDGKPVTVIDDGGHSVGNIYCGRGFVQSRGGRTIWRWEKGSAEVAILKYIDANCVDYLNARRIINGTERNGRQQVRSLCSTS